MERRAWKGIIALTCYVACMAGVGTVGCAVGGDLEILLVLGTMAVVPVAIDWTAERYEMKGKLK